MRESQLSRRAQPVRLNRSSSRCGERPGAGLLDDPHADTARVNNAPTAGTSRRRNRVRLFMRRLLGPAGGSRKGRRPTGKKMPRFHGALEEADFQEGE